MSTSETIECPSCGTTIDVQNALSHQLEEQIKRKLNAEMANQKSKMDAEIAQIAKEKAALVEAKKKEAEQIAATVEIKMAEEKKRIEAELKSKISKEQEDQIEAIQKELNEKSLQIKELNTTKAELQKIKREKDELKGTLELEAQVKLNEQLAIEKEKIRKQEEEKNELKTKELLKKIEDQGKLVDEMKRKQEQGSMQMQGEIMELAIEEWLRNKFPLDGIEEIQKGARGGDCIQTVNTRTASNCGTIYYESKRTKEFKKEWIAKFKADIQEKGATIGVLVTEVFPSDMERLGMKDGIWICTYEEFKGLSEVLRESVILLHNNKIVQENKGDKMGMLYDFLTSNEFRMYVEGIVEGFTQMNLDLLKEKKAMTGIWKAREKQIEKVTNNAINMYGAIKGIAGSAIQNIKELDLPEDSDLLLED
jgi:hypothetical protein